MSAKLWLGVMVAGTAVVILAGTRDEERPQPPAKPREEVPWFSNEAAAQVVGPEGELGPLFAGVGLGLPAPSQDVRTRIAEFARAHNVDIDLEIRDGDLAVIRFAVTYGGCCGYEAADVFARRLRRPGTGRCSVCGPDMWVDDWAIVSESGVHMRAKVRVNRVMLRWQRAETIEELVERADALLGADRDVVAKANGDRWHELEPGRRYLLEVPFPYVPPGDFGSPPPLENRRDLGMLVQTKAGQITSVMTTLRTASDDKPVDWKKLLQDRWGKPKIVEYNWNWRRSDRVITATVDSYEALLLIER